MQENNIHWFPGHMMKTLRMIEADVHSVDAVAELVDARLPLSSRNPELVRLTSAKPRVLLLNKSDLADERMTRRWLDYYRAQGYGALAVQAKDRAGRDRYVKALCTCVEEARAAAGRKATGAKPRIMVVGIPNVGKSTFINLLAGSVCTKAEDRPGVTRGKQWITLPELELLDMPGVLWRKLEDQQGAVRLALTGSIKDDLLDAEELACCALDSLKDNYADKLRERFRLTDEQLGAGVYELLEAVAKNRGMLLPGGAFNTERAAAAVLDELRGGKLGRITFEAPPQ